MRQQNQTLMHTEIGQTLQFAAASLAQLINITESPIERVYYRETLDRLGVILTNLPKE